MGSIPQKVMTQNGYPLFIEVHNKGSWSEENTGDNDSYFFLKGYKWDERAFDTANLCQKPGEKTRLTEKFDDIIFKVALPADLPLGDYSVTIPYTSGMQRHFASYLGPVLKSHTMWPKLSQERMKCYSYLRISADAVLLHSLWK